MPAKPNERTKVATPIEWKPAMKRGQQIVRQLQRRLDCIAAQCLDAADDLHEAGQCDEAKAFASIAKIVLKKPVASTLSESE